jgi:hypothetical protein
MPDFYKIAEKLLVWTLRKGGGSTFVAEPGSVAWLVIAPGVLEHLHDRLA